MKRYISYILAFLLLLQIVPFELFSYAEVTTQTVVKKGNKIVEINAEHGKNIKLEDVVLDENKKIVGTPKATVDNGEVRVVNMDYSTNSVSVEVKKGTNKQKAILTDTIEGWVRVGHKETRNQPFDAWITIPNRKITKVLTTDSYLDKYFGNFLEGPSFSGFNGKDSVIYAKLSNGKRTENVYYRDVIFQGNKPINQYVSSEVVSNNKITLYLPYTSTQYFRDLINVEKLIDGSLYVDLEIKNGLFQDTGKRTSYFYEEKHTVQTPSGPRIRMGTSMSPFPSDEVFNDGTNSHALSYNGMFPQGYGGAGWDRIKEVIPLNGTVLKNPKFTGVGQPYWNRTTITYAPSTPSYDVRLSLAYDIIEYYPVIKYEYEEEVTKYLVNIEYEYEEKEAIVKPVGKPIAFFKMPSEAKVHTEVKFEELSMPAPGKTLIAWHWETSSDGVNFTTVPNWNKGGDRKYTFNTTGTKYVRLRVMQNDLQWSEFYTLPIDIFTDPIKDPEAHIIGPNVVFEDEEAIYYLSGQSFNKDGVVENAFWEHTGSYNIIEIDSEWDPKDGKMTVVFPAHGEYTLKGRVRDNYGLVSELAEQTVTVLKLPIANMNMSGSQKINRKLSIDLSNSRTAKLYPEFTSEIEITPITTGLTQSDIRKEPKVGHSQDVLFKKPGTYQVRARVTQTGNGKQSDWVEQNITIMDDIEPEISVTSLPVINRDYSNSNKTVIEVKRTSKSNDADLLFPFEAWGQKGEMILYGKFDVNGNGFSDDTQVVLFNSSVHQADTDYNTGDYTVKYVTSEKKFLVTVNPNRVGQYQFQLWEREAFGQESIIKTGFASDGDRRAATSLPIIVKVDNISPIADFMIKTQPKVDLILNASGLDVTRKSQVTTNYMAQLVQVLQNNGIDTNVEYVNNPHEEAKMFTNNNSWGQYTIDKVTNKKYLSLLTTGNLLVYEQMENGSLSLYQQVNPGYLDGRFRVGAFQVVVDNGNIAFAFYETGFYEWQRQVVLHMYNAQNSTWTKPFVKQGGLFTGWVYAGYVDRWHRALPKLELSYSSGTGKAYVMYHHAPSAGMYDGYAAIASNDGTIRTLYSGTDFFHTHYDIEQDEAGFYHALVSDVKQNKTYYVTNRGGNNSVEIPHYGIPRVAYETNKLHFYIDTLTNSDVYGTVNILNRSISNTVFNNPYSMPFIHNNYSREYNGEAVNFGDITLKDGKVYLLLPEYYDYANNQRVSTSYDLEVNSWGVNFHLHEFTGTSLGKYITNARLNFTDSTHPYYKVNNISTTKLGFFDESGGTWESKRSDIAQTTTQYVGGELLTDSNNIYVLHDYARGADYPRNGYGSSKATYSPHLLQVSSSNLLSDAASKISTKNFREGSSRFYVMLSDKDPNDGGAKSSNQLLVEGNKKGVDLIFSGKNAFKNAISSISDFSTWVNDTTINPLLNNIATLITNKVDNDDNKSVLILLKDEKILIDEWYGDLEKDIVFNTKTPISQRWRVVHDEIFSNSLGKVSFNNQTLTQKPTGISDTFQGKVGRFRVTYEVLDNPPGQSSYQKWSTQGYKDVLIHRRPTSSFVFNTNKINDNSTDIDGHTIPKRTVRFRKLDETTFTEVHNRSEVFIPEGEYYVEQIVWDELGAESYPFSMIVDSPGGGSNPSTPDTPIPIALVKPKIVLRQSGTLKENREFKLDATESIAGTYPIDLTKTTFSLTGSHTVSQINKLDVSSNLKRVQVKGYGSINTKVRVYDIMGNFTEEEFTYIIQKDLEQVTDFTVNATALIDVDNDKQATFNLKCTSNSTDDYIASRKWYFKRIGVDEDYRELFAGDDDPSEFDFDIPFIGLVEIKLVTTEGFSQPYMDQFVTVNDFHTVEAIKTVEVINRKPEVDFKLFGLIEGEVEGMSLLGGTTILKFPNTNAIYEQAGDSQKGFVDLDGDKMAEAEWTITHTKDVDNTETSIYNGQTLKDPVLDFDMPGRYEITFRAKDENGLWSEPVTRVHFVRRKPTVNFEVLPNIRYIRDTIEGNTVDGLNHWSSIKAFNQDGNDVALGRLVTSSADLSDSNYITDGNISTTATGIVGTQFVEIDLGAKYTIRDINVLHSPGNIYKRHKLEVSSDGVNWVTVYHKDSVSETGTLINPFADTKTFYRGLEHKVIDWSYDEDYVNTRMDKGIINHQRNIRMIGETDITGFGETFSVSSSGQYEINQLTSDFDGLKTNSFQVIAMITPTIIDIPAEAHAGETITIHARADKRATRVEAFEEYNEEMIQLALYYEDADFTYWTVDYTIPATTSDGQVNFTSSTIMDFGYKFMNYNRLDVVTPLEIDITLEPSYPDPIAASENLGVTVVTESPIDVVSLEVWLEGESSVNLTKESVSGEFITWKGTYNVRATKPDNDFYSFNAKGTLLNAKEKVVNDKVKVLTPVNLVPTTPFIVANVSNSLNAKTSKYVTNTSVRLFVGTPYETPALSMTGTLSGNIKDWNYSYLCPDTIPDGDYTARFTSSTPNGNVEVKDVVFSATTLTIEGFVNHTPEWDTNRKKYNVSKSGNDSLPRTYDMFFPGERFMLRGETTVGTVADRVDVHILGTSYNTTLTNVGGHVWEGSLWHEDMMNWTDRLLTFRFTAYKGAITRTDDVIVRIVDDEYWRLRRKF